MWKMVMPDDNYVVYAVYAPDRLYKNIVYRKYGILYEVHHMRPDFAGPLWCRIYAEYYCIYNDAHRSNVPNLKRRALRLLINNNA